MKKNQVRKGYSEKRRSLTPETVAELSQAMLHHFASIRWSRLAHALSYHPIAHHQEFDPSSCEAWLRKLNPDVVIAHPRITDDPGAMMEAVEVSDGTLYETNNLRIREPAAGRLLTPESFDLVMTPLLAFDQNGYRVGYGKGFYDRWLAQCRPEVIKVGFSFFEPVEPVEDINEFDVPLNYCITPMRVYEF